MSYKTHRRHKHNPLTLAAATANTKTSLQSSPATAIFFFQPPWAARAKFSLRAFSHAALKIWILLAEACIVKDFTIYPKSVATFKKAKN